MLLPCLPGSQPKAAAAAEGAAPATGLPDKLQFNFFVPHETLCQNEKVGSPLRGWHGRQRSHCCHYNVCAT